MAERPGSGGPDEGKEFGWLYGRRPGGDPAGGDHPAPGPAPEANPEATRVMPVQPRPDGAPPPTVPTGPRPPQPAPTPYGDTPPPPPPGPGAPRRPGGGFWARRLRRPGFYVRTLLVLLVLWLVYIVAVPFITWQSSEQVAFEPDGERPGEQDGTTYLMVGSDSRADLSREDRQRLTTGNPTSELTDTILLLHTGDGPSVLLSIPRDTQVDTAGYSGKINGAFASGGAPLLTQIIENETGIRVDEYVQIGLGGVADVVDAVGGIEVCPRERIRDPLAGLNISRGCQEVNGETALGYSRSRKESALGDLARVERQREVIGAIGDKVLSPWSVINPVRWWRLNDAVPTFFRFGEGMSSIGASRWAYAMTKTGGGDNLTCTMPVTSPSATEWDRDRADPLLAAVIADQTDDITRQQCTPNGIPRQGNQ